MKKEGGCEWYQSMGHIFLYISATFLLFCKGPWPFKSQKTHFSGLTTQYVPRLNLVPSAAKKHDSGWVIAWIFLDSGRNLFRSTIINNNCNKKIRETLYSTLLFADFFIHIARGKLMKFLPAIMPIPERTR
jgi:hypothetical protein